MLLLQFSVQTFGKFSSSANKISRICSILGSLNSLPGGGQLDENSFLLDSMLFVHLDQLDGFRHTASLVEGQPKIINFVLIFFQLLFFNFFTPGIDLGGDASGDDF
jgi:hypothetical protein